MRSAFELCLGDETLRGFLDRLACDANAVAPGLGRERARSLAKRVLAARVAQTEACGRFAACRPDGPVWGTKPTPPCTARPCRFVGDPDETANVFAASAADLLGVDGDVRDAYEERLALVFRAALRPLLFRNERCGRVAICGAPSTDPFQ